MIVPPVIKHFGEGESFFANIEDVRCLFESYDLVKDILDDSEKAMIWMNTPNPLLGQLVPLNMILIGRGHKLLAFIKNAKDENFEEDVDV